MTQENPKSITKGKKPEAFQSPEKVITLEELALQPGPNGDMARAILASAKLTEGSRDI